ncbi:2-dehydropantoate 2-reductase [Alkalihalobacillus xiaoxiensis]|uniref:2-dehydropantoate 2-reductase n=1 Tax=Shouchella xiaoxiensis TaxID=766895 RepID=A0ABS2SUA5_9BACI|nr:ketopantoate reductase family protein [Shouchella xiaoxiensis]MBM7838756.1 2-dehydropantoate 2-reductase [Shouchella xiaoxiensis]
MNILSVGAGGIGGYFGARLVEKGEDVTFLVRQQRRKQLAESGLTVKSIHGDYSFSPKLVTAADQDQGPFDLVLFTTKSYQLQQAIEDVRPFVHEKTIILPLLNGVAHFDQLKQAFGDRVIGGLCFIETSLADDGSILQESQIHRLAYGEWDGQETERMKQLQQLFSGTKADFVYSGQVDTEIWHKYLFITVASGVTTLFRSAIGPIRDSEQGYDYIRTVLAECALIMTHEQAPISEEIVATHMKTFESISHSMKSSMLRDMERGAETEGDHLQGHLLQLADKHKLHVPLLTTIYQNVLIYNLNR